MAASEFWRPVSDENLSSKRESVRRSNEDPAVERLLRLAETIERDDPHLQQLVTLATRTSNQAVQQDVLKLLAVKAAEQQAYPFTKQVQPAPVQVGTTPQQIPVGLQPGDLTKHLLAVGQSGTGKTTLFYTLLDQVSVPFWSFDLKQDYRHLVRHRDDVVVLPWSEFKFNPLQPPRGVPPRRWVQVFAEIFGHATSLLSGSKNYLMKQLVKLYQLYGLLDEVEPPYPSLGELQLLLERDKINYVRKTSNYRDTVLNRLEAMNRTAGSVFNCSQGHGVADLLERNVVFEFDGLSDDTQNFLMEILIAAVYEYRMAQNHRGGDLRHLFVMDEGKRVFSVYKERQDAAGLPTIDALTAQMREFGEGLLVADQEASKLTDSIKANTYTKVLLPTGDRKQFTAMTEAMNLSERQAEFASELSPGEAIIQVGNRDPTPVTLHKYQIEKSVTDDQLQELMADRWAELAHEERVFTPEFDLEIGFHGRDPGDDAGRDNGSDHEHNLSSDADHLLEDILENPFKPLTERYDQFSSREKGNKAKNELLDQGLVFERRIWTKDDRRKLLEFTDKGRAYAEDTLGLSVTHQGRGGIVHRYMQQQLEEAFETAGWETSLEEHGADVYASMGTTGLAVEVAMGNNPRELEHVEEHLDKGFTVWVVCRNDEIREGLKQRLEETDVQSDRVSFRLFRDVIEADRLPLG